MGFGHFVAVDLVDELLGFYLNGFENKGHPYVSSAGFENVLDFVGIVELLSCVVNFLRKRIYLQIDIKARQISLNLIQFQAQLMSVISNRFILSHKLINHLLISVSASKQKPI